MCNSILGPASGPKGTQRGGAIRDGPSSKSGPGLKKIEENLSLTLGGENGVGGRPLKRKPDNPYLEIDLIDPTDPILFEGEI